MKLINLDFAYQMECLKALCLAITCVSHYPIYHSLLGEFTHNWNMMAVYHICKQRDPARGCARCPMLRPPPTLPAVLRGLFPFHFSYILLFSSGPNRPRDLNFYF